MSFWARSRRFFDAKTADSDDVDGGRVIAVWPGHPSHPGPQEAAQNVPSLSILPPNNSYYTLLKELPIQELPFTWLYKGVVQGGGPSQKNMIRVVIESKIFWMDFVQNQTRRTKINSKNKGFRKISVWLVHADSLTNPAQFKFDSSAIH